MSCPAGSRRLFVPGRGELALGAGPIWRSCQATRIASTSGKYLYKVARPIPVAAAICGIVTAAQAVLADQRRGGVQSAASWMARRCSSIVSDHSFGTSSKVEMLV